MKIKRMVKISLFTTVICVIVLIFPSIPIPFIEIPLTLQTLVIMITALLLKPVDAFIAVALYLVLGVMGLPVFSGFKSGLGVLLGPTGGFLISFPFAAFLISKFKGSKSIIRLLMVNFVFGIIFIYIFGIIMFSLVMKQSIIVIAKAMLIFIVIDFIKVILATMIGTKLRSIKFINE